MNVAALLAVLIFAGVLSIILGTLYRGAVRSYRRGEVDFEVIRLLRWALLGHAVIYLLLAVSAFLT